MQPNVSSHASEPKKPLGSRFHRLFAVVTLTGVGDGLTFTALPWLATMLTSSAFLISLVTAANRLPWLLFSLPFGALVDRYPRHLLMAGASIVRAVMIAVLTLAVLGDWISIPLLVVLIFFFGTAKVMYDSTAQTIVPMIVPKSQLERANGLFSSAQLITSDILGGAVCGFLIMLGLPLPFLIDTITSTLSFPLLLGLKTAKPAGETRPQRHLGAETMEGLRFVGGHPLLRSLALFSIGITGTFSALVATQVLYMQEILGFDSFEFGLLISFATVGSILGGQCVTLLKKRFGARGSLLLSLLVMAIGYGLVGLNSQWAVVGGLYFICSFFVVVWSVLNLTFRQRLVPNELLGRVNGVFRFLSWGISSLGALFGGGLITIGAMFYDREWAIRSPYLVLCAVYLVLFFVARRIFRAELLQEAE